MFFKAQRTIARQIGVIQQLAEQVESLESKLAQANDEIERVTLAADRVAIVLNEQADKDRVIKRDLVVALGKEVAKGWDRDLIIPAVPDDVLLDLIKVAIDAKADRGQRDPTLVMSRQQIATVKHICASHMSFPVADGKVQTLFGCEVLAK